jgi:hypothetical protein
MQQAWLRKHTNTTQLVDPLFVFHLVLDRFITCVLYIAEVACSIGANMFDQTQLTNATYRPVGSL